MGILLFTSITTGVDVGLELNPTTDNIVREVQSNLTLILTLINHDPRGIDEVAPPRVNFEPELVLSDSNITVSQPGFVLDGFQLVGVNTRGVNESLGSPVNASSSVDLHLHYKVSVLKPAHSEYHKKMCDDSMHFYVCSSYRKKMCYLFYICRF